MLSTGCVALNAPIPVPLDADTPVLSHQTVTRLEPGHPAERRALGIGAIDTMDEPIRHELQIERWRSWVHGQ